MKLDTKTGSNLLQWPAAEVESLRLRSDEFQTLKAKPGSVVSLDIEAATQVCVHETKFLNSKVVDMNKCEAQLHDIVSTNVTVGHCC